MVQAPPVYPQQVIVVTGTALPDTEGDRAYGTEVISRAILEKSPSVRLDDVLMQSPGFQLFRRSNSTSSHPTSQGITVRGLGGSASSRVLMTLDGVPQADPFGGWVTWPAYSPASLRSVRILRGGGSVTQGPGALGGVIELRSLADDGLVGSIEAGSRGLLRGHSYIGLRSGDDLLTIDAQGERSNSFVPVTATTRGAADQRAPYREGSMRARWLRPVGQGVEAQLSAMAFVDERERGLRFTANRTRGADVSLRLVGRGRWQWSALAYGQWRNLRSSFASVDDERSRAMRVALQDSVPSSGLGAAWEVRPPLGKETNLRIGGDIRRTEGNSREFYSYAMGQPTRRRVSGGQSGTEGVFADIAVDAGILMLTGGLRVDHWQISNGKLVERPIGGAPTRDDSYSPRDGWLPTARAGTQLQISPVVDLRIAGYSGWRLPTLNELFRPFRAGPDATTANAGLEPETLRGVEAELGFHRGALAISMTAFANRLSNAIANVTLGQGPGIFPGVGFVAGAFRQRDNIDAVRIRGMEATSSIHRGPWSLRLGASLTHARNVVDQSAIALNGLRPAQTPDFVLSGELAWEKEGKILALSWRHAGVQYEDDLNTVRLPRATTFDGFAAWPLSGGVRMVVRAQNLFNRVVVAGIDDDGAIERAMPRTFTLGFDLPLQRTSD